MRRSGPGGAGSGRGPVRPRGVAPDGVRVPAAADEDDRPVAGRPQGVGRVGAHEALAGLLGGIVRARRAQQGEVAVEPGRQLRLGRRLGEDVPEGVLVGDAEGGGERPLGRLRTGPVRVGVAVGAAPEGRIPGRQVAEQRPRTHRPARLQGLPFRREGAERRVGGGAARRVGPEREDRHRQVVTEGEVGQVRVEVDRPLDQHAGRPQRRDRAPDEPGAGRGMVAHADDGQAAGIRRGTAHCGVHCGVRRCRAA
ncbi:hypothetical protein ABIC20_000112 [Methylobacterium radiotolerans]|uniref:Uncharacterized protein n=1 Tax=Methylobacterium radiotolerans TaxID=31998 RepID=A0ABV2N8I7_9HYPH